MGWQTNYEAWPDVETLVPALLRDRLGDAADHVGNFRHEHWAGRIVVVRRDGGGVKGVFDRPRLSVRVWVDDAYECIDLAREVRSHVLALPGSEGITRATVMSGPNLIQDDGGPQAYLMCELTVRASATP